jgi:ATP-dependent exoDNAse (exonuclease V) beta subunit
MTASTTKDAQARERIRSSLDESLIVEAAAGTGKTTELVQRIVAVLRTCRTTVDKIVAVTFTRKAAGELRLRLRIELDKARSSATGASEIRFLEDALARLEEAHLGTIHAFCAEILRQRPVEAGIPPGFQEIDESQSARLYSRAFDTWIQQRLQEMSPALRRIISRFSIDRTANPTGNDAGPLEKLRQAGLDVLNWRDFRQTWTRKPFDRDAEIQQIISEVAVLVQIATESTRKNDSLRKRLQPAIDLINRVRRSEEIGRRDMDELEALLIRLARDLKKRTAGAVYDRARFPKINEKRAVTDRAYSSLASQLADFAQRADADLAASLHAELQDLVDLYEDMKARSGKVDFVDLLVRTRDVIRDNASVRQLLQARFSHIFVDEFQDTDPVQAEILVLLSAEDPGETNWRNVRPMPGKLFLVGDPKQSIYRFRRADIILYQEVCAHLNAKGVETVYLSHSFRAFRPIQGAVNAAFSPEIRRNEGTGQPAYVALEGGVPETEQPPQPRLIALPIPRPYGAHVVTKTAIKQCLPPTVAAFVDWLIRKSGWKVRDPVGSGALVPLESHHVAILFKQFMSFGTDLTREYAHALEARNIPHQLWQAKSFHQREEVETVRAALNAIEWPDDELSVFATLKGSLFAIPDSVLLRFRYDVGTFHPLRPQPDDLDNLHVDFHPIRDALQALADLHRRRNRRAIVETVNTVLEMTRAHAAFALRPSGNQVLANVYHICNLARAYELNGGYSFRGFVEQLNDQSETEDSAEAPIVEEGSEGVRIMTVHAAKGLEFPVVILADITANAAFQQPARHIDAEQNLCAVRVAGCAPWELIDYMGVEHDRDLAEGIRLAYVAATRARDLLVIPAVGDGPFKDGWVAPLNKALYPARDAYRDANVAPLCPAFGSLSVLSRPFDAESAESEHERSVKPGLHTPDGCTHSVVWWDPALLNLQVTGNFGLRQEGILGDGPHAAAGRERYQFWKTAHEQALTGGQVPTSTVFVATEGFEPPAGFADRVRIERVQRPGPRPKGPRFGSLVHLILKDVDFTAPPNAVLRLAQIHARLLNAPAEEIQAAAQAVTAALKHPLLERARKAKRCHRELPILLKDEHLGTLDAVIDLAFVEDKTWTIVDFKTDVDDAQRTPKYRRQVGWYIHSIQQTTGAPAQGYLLHL